MNEEEKKLYSELLKLSKQANRRILKSERLTGVKEAFEIKELADKLSTLNMWTVSGRISTKTGLNQTQMTATIKAIKKYIEKPTTIKDIKNKVSSYKDIIGKNITYKQANAIYQVRNTYKDYYESHSEFWDLARETVKESYSLETFTQKFTALMGEEYIDKEFKNDLENLYYYAKGVKN